MNALVTAFRAVGHTLCAIVKALSVTGEVVHGLANRYVGPEDPDRHLLPLSDASLYISARMGSKTYRSPAVENLTMPETVAYYASRLDRWTLAACEDHIRHTNSPNWRSGDASLDAFNASMRQPRTPTVIRRAPALRFGAAL